MKRSSNQLGAIVGRRHVEFRVGSDVFEAFGIANAQAVCVNNFSDIDVLIDQAIDQGRYNYPPEVVLKLRDRAFREIAAMQSKGVPGRIPICLFRRDWQDRLTKYERKAEGVHERFHAAVRRAESARGLNSGDSCVEGNIGDALMQLHPEGGHAYAAGVLAGWAQDPGVVPEEVLARVEEVRAACAPGKGGKKLKNPRYCAAANQKWAEQFVAINAQIAKMERQMGPRFQLYGSRIDPDVLWRLADKVKKQYGGSMGLVQNAIDKCAAPSAEEINKKRLERYSRRLNLARKRGEYLPVAKRPVRMRPVSRVSMIELD
jgi:hypothetical protein